MARVSNAGLSVLVLFTKLSFLLWIRPTKGEGLCSTEMNVAFAVEGSFRLGDANFQHIFNFILNVSNNFDVSTNKTWIITVAGNETNVYKTKEGLDNATAPRFPNSSHVFLGKALESIKDLLNGNDTRRDAATIVVVITSQKSDDDIAIPTINLKSSNMTVFAVAIGSELSLGQLKEIASDPDDHHLLTAMDTIDLLKNVSTNLAKKICEVVDKCVSSPCHNNGNCTSFTDGYKCTCSPEFHGDNCEISKSVEFLHLGCFGDRNASQAIPSLESDSATYLDGDFKTRDDAIKKCALEAAKKGYKVFAIQNFGACHSGPHAHLNYSVYGDEICSGGKGDVFKNDVYLLGAKCGSLLKDKLIHLSSSTIRGSSSNNSWGVPLLDGNYSWCPTNDDLQRKLEIELGRETYITAVTIQGKKDSRDYPDNYCFGSTVGDGRMQEITRDESTSLINLSNSSSNDKTQVMPSSGLLQAQYLRFNPWRPFKVHGLCLRIDVFRKYNTSTESSILREEGNNITCDDSTHSMSFTCPPLVHGNVSWCPANPIPGIHYLQVNLGKPFNISNIVVQGAKDARDWPYKFRLEHSLDGMVFSKLTQNQTSCLLFSQDTVDQLMNTNRTYAFPLPRLVKSVSMQPKYATYGTTDGYCLRTDMIGCTTTTVDGEKVTKGCSHKTKKGKCCVFPFIFEGQMKYSCIKNNHNQPWCATTDNYDRDKLWDNCQENSPCHAKACLNGGRCVENLMEWTYKCICTEKYTGDHCEDDFDECYNSLCQNGGVCVNRNGNYRCDCKHGYSGKNCQLECKFNQLDLGFLVDGSASVQFYGKDHFQLIKDSLKSFIRTFNVSSDATHVGIIVYSTNATVVFKLDRYSSQKGVHEAIDNMTYPAGGTYTGQALTKAAEDLFGPSSSRPGNVSKFLVLVTDGVSTDDVTQSAAVINSSGVVTYVVGIGQNYDHSQLLQIAVNVPDHVFEAQFKTLSEAFSMIRGKICQELDKCADNPCRFGGVCQNSGLNCTCAQGFQGPKCSSDVKECSNSSYNCTSGRRCTETFGGFECTCANNSLYGENCTKDCSNEGSTILFLLDRARNVGQENIKRQVEFIISVASTLSFRNIAVISYATEAEIVIRPGQASNFSEFSETLRSANYSMGHMKKLGIALQKAQEIAEIYNHSKSALVVAMILGKSNDDEAPYAAELKQRGVTILALALDSSYNLAQLNLLVSNPSNDHILTTNLTYLKHFVSKTRNAVCKAWNPCSIANCPSGHECRNNYGKDGGFRCIPPPSVCQPNPCMNGGKCNDLGSNTYNCTCPAGIGGVNCTEDNVNECDALPCKNSGTCRDLLGTFECVCPEKFSGKECEIACSTQRFNLVFLVDGSGSIEVQGKGNFQRSKDFLIALVRKFGVAQDETNVATVLYWNHYRIIHRLNTFYTIDDIEKAIQAMDYPAGGTRTGQGLNVIRNEIFKNLGAARQKVPKVVVVLTDGLSKDSVVSPARALRDMGAIIFSVGVGCCYYKPELNEIATDPDADHVFEAKFSDLQKITESLREKICSAIDVCSGSPCENNETCTSFADDFQCNCSSSWTGKTCSIDVDECATNVTQCNDNQFCHNYPGGSTCLCSNNRYGDNCTIRCNHTKVDVGFLVDSSGSINMANRHNYQRIKDFIKGFVKSVVIGQNETRIGLATFSSRDLFKVQFNFSEYSTTEALVNAVQNISYDAGGTFTGGALNRIRTDLFNMAREGIPKVLVILTDGKSQDSITDPLKRVRDEGVHIISVGVGDAVYSELADMASEPDTENIFNVTFESLNNIFGSLQDSVCKVVDPCFSSPCQNGGKCESLLSRFNCACPAGFIGEKCETKIDQCSSKPCNNVNKICITFPGRHFCNCKPGNFEIQNSCSGEYTSIFNIVYGIYIGESIDRDRKGNFAKQIAFVKGLSKTFNVSRNDTNVGIITYSGSAMVRYSFENISNQADLENALDTLNISGSGRNIGKALHLAHSDLFNQSNTGRNVTVRNILIVITDGGSDDDLAFPTHALKMGGVTIFSVGIDQYVRGQLNEMASDPDSEHVFTIDFYDGLGPTMAPLKDAIIKEVDPCATKPCSNNGSCTNLPGGGFTCNCTEEWTGKRCDIQTTNCTRSPHPCNNNGNCTLKGDGSVECKCFAGWEGINCGTDTNECLKNPCLNGGNCTNTNGSYLCQCPLAFTGDNCEMHCDHHFMNLGFMVDGSAAVELSGHGNFNKSLEFVANLIGSFDISKNATNPGMVVFSEDPHLVFNFSTHNNPTDVMAAVKMAPYPNRGRKIGKALNFVRQDLFSESETGNQKLKANYLIVLTSGASYDQVKTPVELLREKNVTVFGIGIGNNYDVDQLKLVSGDNGTRVYKTSYQHLGDLKKKLKKAICLLQELNKCSPSPCLNGGRCINTGKSFRCICVRGYYGNRCELGCGFRELGLKIPNPRRIPDKHITSSSQRDTSHAAHRGRIGIEVMGTWEDGWCSSQTDTAPYFQVFFEYLTNITEIGTEGVEDGTTNLWVESYYVSTSNSTDETSFVNYTEKGNTKIFRANTRITATNVSLYGTSAHFIRIHPLNHTGSFACLRVALYGCDSEGDFKEFPSSLLERISNAPNTKDPLFDTRLAAIPVALFVFLLLGSLFFLLLPLSTPSPPGPTLRETMVRLEPDPPQHGAIPLVPSYEVQSLSMQLGAEPDVVQVEGVDTASNDVIFSNDNKVFSFDRQVSLAREGHNNVL